MVLHVRNHVLSWLQMASSGLLDGDLKSPCFMSPTWVFLGASLASFGLFGTSLGASWGPLVADMGKKRILGASWGCLRASKGVQNRFWTVKIVPPGFLMVT